MNATKMPGELVAYPVQTGCCSVSNLLLIGCSQQELNNKLQNTWEMEAQSKSFQSSKLSVQAS